MTTFDGTWEVFKNEMYDEFLEAMGVDGTRRKMALRDNLKLRIQQDGNKFKIVERTVFRDMEYTFTIGTPHNYTLSDGTDLTGVWTLENGILFGSFTRLDNGKPLTIKREIVNGQLITTYVYEGVEANRYFNKV